MEFLHLFCWRYFAGKPPVVLWNVDHFLRLYIILPILSILDSTMNQGCPKFGDCVPWGKKATNLFTGNVAMEAEALVHDLRPSNWFSLSYKKAKPLPTVKRLHVSFKSIRLFYLKSGTPLCSTKLYSNKMPVVKSSVDKTLYLWYFKISVLILTNQTFN